MNQQQLTLNELFKQLGLKHEDSDIEQFIDKHSPVDKNTPIYEAPCWTPSQADFLKQAISDDSDWTVIVDDLSERLRP